MSKIGEALAITAEVCGTQFSDPAAMAIVAKLSVYPVGSVLKALDRCQTEVKGRLSLASIIERIETGRPSADEAWSIAVDSMDESKTVVTNNEIAEACGIAKVIYESGDEVGARMAFRSAYERVTSENRYSQPDWWASVGTNKDEAETVINNAVDLGLLTNEYAVKVLPHKIEKEVANNVLRIGMARVESKKGEDYLARLKEMLNA